MGVLIVIFPEQMRQHKAYEWGRKKPRWFIVDQRITGCALIILAIVLMVLGIE